MAIGSEFLDLITHAHPRADSVGLGCEQRGDSGVAESERKIGSRREMNEQRGAGALRMHIGIRVLAGYELEGVHMLAIDGVGEEETHLL